MQSKPEIEINHQPSLTLTSLFGGIGVFMILPEFNPLYGGIRLASRWTKWERIFEIIPALSFLGDEGNLAYGLLASCALGIISATLTNVWFKLRKK